MRWELQCRICIAFILSNEKGGVTEGEKLLALYPCRIFFDPYVSAADCSVHISHKGHHSYEVHPSLYTIQILEMYNNRISLITLSASNIDSKLFSIEEKKWLPYRIA
jgi:hypothetical protein